MTTVSKTNITEIPELVNIVVKHTDVENPNDVYIFMGYFHK